MKRQKAQSDLGRVDKLKSNKSISLDEDEATYARQIGGGNLSRGVQRALKFTKNNSHQSESE